MAEKFLTQEQLSAFCSSLAMLLRSGASHSEASSLFEEDGMDTALRQASTEISLSVAAGEPFSAAAEKKREAMGFYRSLGNIDYAGRILGLNHYRGIRHNVAYEEDYTVGE